MYKLANMKQVQVSSLGSTPKTPNRKLASLQLLTHSAVRAA